MGFKYKADARILDRLKAAGYTTYRIRHERILGERVLQKFRTGELPSWNELDTICKLLSCQPWDLIEYIHDDEATPSEELTNKKDSHE